MSFRVLCTSIALALLVGVPATAVPLGEVLVWEIPSISEDQVKNSPANPPGDGSSDSSATGWASIEISDNPDFIAGTTSNPDQEYLISITVNWTGLLGDLTKIHIHGWLDPMGNPIGPNNSTPTHLYEVPGLENDANTIASGVDRNDDTYVVTQAFLPHTHPFDDLAAIITPAQIIDEFRAGRAYFNIHSTLHPMGEIRGNLGALPEPSVVTLLGTGLLAAAAGRRRRR